MDRYRRYFYRESVGKKRYYNEYEEYVYVLDYFLDGYIDIVSGRRIGKLVVQVIGEKVFMFFEVILKIDFMFYERVFIGKGNRDKILFINKRIFYDEFIDIVKVEFLYVVEEIVKNNEERFVQFFNMVLLIINRFYSFEFLFGIGKKYMWEIIEERQREFFKSFEDLKQRVKGFFDFVKMIVKRIVDEFQDKDRYKLFVGYRRLFCV